MKHVTGIGGVRGSDSMRLGRELLSQPPFLENS